MNAPVLDDAGFEEAATRHRRELHVHCYRMLGSFQEAEDAVQDTLLRAWRARHTLREAAAVRAWLYRIATTTCIDRMRAHGRRRALPSDMTPGNVDGDPDAPVDHAAWLQPYPDVLLDEIDAARPGRPAPPGPEERAVTREQIELAFMAGLQLLPWQQRVAVVAKDVLGWTAVEVAELLETTVPAVNSALHRGRTTLRERGARLGEQRSPRPSAGERRVLDAFMRALEANDAEGIIDLLSADARCTMPPYEFWFDGREASAASLREGMGERAPGDWRVVPLAMNRQPGTLTYCRRRGDDRYRAFALHVLTVVDGRLAELTAFQSPELFPLFGWPLELDDADPPEAAQLTRSTEFTPPPTRRRR